MDNTSFAPGNNSINNSVPPLTPQYSAPEPKHFLNKKFVVTFVVLLLLGSGAYVGIWYWQNQQVAQEVVPTFTPRASVTADPTADWKTYTNAQYGFEFKYPVDWKIDDNLKLNRCCLDVFNSPEPYQGDSLKQNVMKAQFQYQTLSTVSSMEQFINRAIADNNQSEMSPKITRGSITNFKNQNGIDIIKFDYGQASLKYTYSIPMKPDFSQMINILVWNPDPVFDQILSTFKFTDSVDTSTWKTYTNTQYGFSFMYPLDWTYDGTSEIFFDKIDPATGKRQFSEGTGGFNLSIVDGNISTVYTKVRNECQTYGTTFKIADPVFSYQAITLAGKSGWEVNCSSEYGGPFTVTILPVTVLKTIKINSGYKSTLHNQIISTFKFTK